MKSMHAIDIMFLELTPDILGPPSSIAGWKRLSLIYYFVVWLAMGLNELCRVSGLACTYTGVDGPILYYNLSQPILVGQMYRIYAASLEVLGIASLEKGPFFN